MDTKNKNISYQPTDGLSYDPSEEKYWDAKALEKEIERTFEICHGCRLCFKYCDSFPNLFSLLDKKYDGEVKKLTSDDTKTIMDACFQCKLCEVQCPYTVRDKHEFKLDFPKLVHRYKAQKARKEGLSLREKILGAPDQAGMMARSSLGLANMANRVKLHRLFMEKLLGIHRDKLLPDFASSTFEKWAKVNSKIKPDVGGEAVLFQTCYVQNNQPEIGRDTVEVLEKNGVDVRCIAGLQCCGMPAWEHGDLESLKKQAKTNLKILAPFVEKGAKVLAINPTCSMMMRKEYPTLLDPSDRPQATKLAEAVMDPSEFLWSICNEPRFNSKILSNPNTNISYHAPCHLRAQAVGFKGRDLLRKILGVNISTVMECCGHNGTYAMTVEGFLPSARIGKKAFDGMTENKTEICATDCPLAALQFQQHAGINPMHPMSILARAYREDGFKKK